MFGACPDSRRPGRQEAQEVRVEGGKYTVALPGKPTTGLERRPAGGPCTSAKIEKGRCVYIGDLLRPAGRRGARCAKPKDCWTADEKGLIDNFKAKVSSSKDYEFGEAEVSPHRDDRWPRRMALYLRDPDHPGRQPAVPGLRGRPEGHGDRQGRRTSSSSRSRSAK